jgi:hypothetical protein
MTRAPLAHRLRTSLLLLSLVATANGCVEEDTASLSARVEAPRVSVEESTLVSELSGGFTLVLALGSYASEATEVSLGVFTLDRAGETVFGPIPLSSSTHDFPVSVGVGKSVQVEFEIEDGTSVAPEQSDALCDGPLSFVGSLSDTLGANKPIRVESAALDAECELLP